MSDNQEIGTLLKNIQEGLKKYSVNELNDAIVRALTNKHHNTEEIEYVISIVCNMFNISEHSLINDNKRGILQEAKQITYCLLYFDVRLSIRYIANSIFLTDWHTSVQKGIKRFKQSDVQIKQDKEFIEKYEKLRSKLILFVKDQNKHIA